MRGAWVILCLFGCNQIYGLDETKVRPGSGIDLDLDGIDDDVDPCIASAEDGLEDSDSDASANATDPCPHDQGGSDEDGDTIPEICDPFPGVADDRWRCTMTFANPDLNRRLWIEHGGSGEWAFGNGHLQSQAFAKSSLLSAADLDGALQSTVDVRAFSYLDTGASKAFRIWVDATDTPSGVACELRGSSAGSTLAIVDAAGTEYAAQQTIAFPSGNAFRIIATRSRDAVRCIYVFGSRLATIRAQVATSNGRFGFYFDSGNSDAYVQIETLAIYERDAIVTP